MSLTQLARRITPQALYPSSVLRRLVQRRTSLRVQAGPFRGMDYIGRSVWGAYVPKLLGTYELELHAALEQAIAEKPKRVIDIGGAEGYYAVGLLLRLEQAQLTVFEQLEDARSAIRELAARNAVGSRLEIAHACSPELLQRALEPQASTFVVCDVEGYERELLDPARVPGLLHADLLVEVHDAQVPGVSALLTERFASTHEVVRIDQARRTLAHYPYRDLAATVWPGAVLKYGLNEFRSPANGWLWMKRREAAVA